MFEQQLVEIGAQRGDAPDLTSRDQLLDSFRKRRALFVADRLRKEFVQLIDQQHQRRPQRLVGMELALRRLGDARECAGDRPRGRRAAAPQIIGERGRSGEITLRQFRQCRE